MDNITINLEFIDKGYGIKHFSQTVPLGDGTIEFIVKSLTEGEGAQANAIVARAWAWASENMEQIKDYLSTELAKEFEEMRQKKDKNVPSDDAAAIRVQLSHTPVSRITFFPSQAVFTLDFMGKFNGYLYRMYVTVNDDLTFERGSLLTMGGFKPRRMSRKGI